MELPPGFELDDEPKAQSAPTLPDGFALDAAPKAEAPKKGLVEDTAKSAASGLGRGVAALPGMLGDVQQLAEAAPWSPHAQGKRSMMDALLEKVGMSHLPTSQDTIGAAAKVVPGLDYKPETGLGEMTQKATEFVPGAVLGGGEGGLGAVRNAVRYGLAPGVTSDVAQQMAQGTGYEPLAGAAGAVLGGLAGPKVLSAPAKLLSPVAQDPQIAAHVNLLRQEGVPLTAGQATGSQRLKWAEAVAQDVPLGPASNADARTEAFNRAATRRAGYETPNATPDWYRNAQQDLGQRYDAITARNAANLDTNFLGDLGVTSLEYHRNVSPAMQNPSIRQYIGDLAQQARLGAPMAGDVYQSKRSELVKWAKSADGPDRDAITGIRRALDDAMDRSISPADRNQWAELNQQYSAFKTIEDALSRAGVDAARGNITPANLAGAVRKGRKSQYLNGSNELAELGKAGVNVLKEPPSSGTMQRHLYQSIPQAVGAALGGAGGGISGATAGALVGPAVMGHAVMSRPVQAWLANQMAHGINPMFPPAPAGAQRRALIAAGLLGAD